MLTHLSSLCADWLVGSDGISKHARRSPSSGDCSSVHPAPITAYPPFFGARSSAATSAPLRNAAGHNRRASVTSPRPILGLSVHHGSMWGREAFSADHRSSRPHDQGRRSTTNALKNAVRHTKLATSAGFWANAIFFSVFLYIIYSCSARSCRFLWGSIRVAVFQTPSLKYFPARAL